MTTIRMQPISAPVCDIESTRAPKEQGTLPEPQGYLNGWLKPLETLWQSRLAADFGWLLCLVPVCLGFYYVYTYGVNIGWDDQFGVIPPLFAKWYAGTLSSWDFWAQHNEHRLVVPHLLMVFLGLLSDWNTLAEMYLVQLLLLAMLAMHTYVFSRTSRTRHLGWMLLPVAFAVFSLRQHNNMLSGYQLGFVLVTAEALASFLCLYLLNDARRLIPKFVAGIAFATLATFSAAQGLLVWPVGLLQLVFLPTTRRSRLILSAVWTILGILEWSAYFWNYVKPLWHPPLSFDGRYFATFLGAALFSTVSVAATAGVIILAITALAKMLVLAQQSVARHSYWLAIIVFALLVALQTAAGRSGFGSEQALSSRYATFSLLIPIGVYAILSSLNAPKFKQQASALGGALVGLMALGIILSMAEGYHTAAAWKRDRDYHAFIFLTSESQPDESLRFAPWEDPTMLRQSLAILQEHGLNIFASPARAQQYAVPAANLPVLAAPTRAALNPLAIAKETGIVTVAGWAVSDSGDDVAGGVFLEVDGTPYAAYYGLPREDVAQDLKNPRLKCCGFSRDFPARLMRPGEHRLVVKVLTKDRQAYFQPQPPVTLTVN
jgi:hypothetical protein